MSDIHTECPSCHARLKIPSAYVKQYVRCPKCKEKFALTAQPKKVVEDVVASWLTDEVPDDDSGPAADEIAAGISGGERAAKPKAPAAPRPASQAAPAAASKRNIRVVSGEMHGVLLEFPATRLREPVFRSAFPRRCLSCEARTHLRAHVVIFAPRLHHDSISLEAEHSADKLDLTDEKVRGLSGPEVLEQLHKIDNVPPPGNLPMPYWICDMCSGANQVAGQIKLDPDTGKGRCRLFIHNMYRALELLVNAAAESAEGFEALRQRVENTAERPWDDLSETVQHRIQEWFQPEADEQFVAYVPDRDHVRTEDGVAGVVISDKRMIYHTPRHHREVTVKQPMTLELYSERARQWVSIATPDWSVKQFTVDRHGLTRMRRSLTLRKFQAVWH